MRTATLMASDLRRRWQARPGPMKLLLSLIDPAVPRRTRLVRGALLSIVVAACIFRVWLIVTYNPIDHVFSDPGRHWHLGTHPLETGPMAAIDPVGYQIYLGVIAKLTVHSPVLVAYWTSLLSLSGPWLWYRFLREATPGRDWALAGWALLAALPSWVAIYSYFMQETLMLPLLGAALWATWRCRRKGGTASFVVAVLAWLLAGLTRGICLPLGAVAMTWLWFGQDRKLPRAAASMALVLAIMGPLAGRSWALARMISPHGIGQLVQLYLRSGMRNITVDFMRGGEHWTARFASPSMSDAPLAPFSNWRTKREWTAHFVIDLDAGERDWKAAMDSLPWTPARAARLSGENLVYLFFGSSWPDTNRERLIGEVNYWSRWLWPPLTVVCLVLTVAWRARLRERLLPALILTWFAVQAVFPLSLNEGRYRKPFEGLLLAQCLVLASSRQKHAVRGERPAAAAITAIQGA